MSTKNLYQRIAAVMAQVGYVKKDSLVQAGRESYRAVSHDAVMRALRPAMLEAGIVSTVTQVGEGKIYEGQTRGGSAKIRFQALYHVAYVNIDSPDDRLDIEMEAHAEDMGDKAPGKAASYAVKTAHLKTFSLETGEDDEQRQAPAAVMAPPAAVRVVDMRETYRKAAAFLEWNTTDVEDAARAAIAAEYGGEVPETVVALSEPLATIVRARLRAMAKTRKDAAETAARLAAEKVEDPADDAVQEGKADNRRKAINARIGELGLDREEVKAGIGVLFGVHSTGACGSIPNDDWKRIMEDLPGVADAGRAAIGSKAEGGEV